MDSTNNPEQDLIDDQIVTKLYKEYSNRILVQARKAFPSQEDAEDVMQETFLRIWKYRHLLSQIRNMGAWINTIANSVICDKIKNRSKHNHLSLEDITDNEEINPILISKKQEPSQIIEAQEFIEILYQALSEVANEEQSKVWILRNIQKYTTKEIAEELNKKPELIRRWNRQITLQIKLFLEKTGYTI